MTDPVSDLFERLYNGRCPACFQGFHDECDPLVAWSCACSHPTCCPRLHQADRDHEPGGPR